jgi:hypothetical protein
LQSARSDATQPGWEFPKVRPSRILQIMRGLGLLFAVLFSGAVLADPAEPLSAAAIYRAGDWERAEQLAVTASDASSRTLAAQAVLAQLMSGSLADQPARDRRAAARRAQAHARAALDINPEYAPAHLRLAAGLGYEGRYVSPLRAVFLRLPQNGREHIEQAMALDPGDPWGPAMLGAWHFEVVRRAGEGRLDSSLTEGFAHYRAAVAAQGVEPAIPYHFALALAARDPVAHREEIDALLVQVAADTSDGAFDQIARDLAVSLGAVLEQDSNQAQALAIERLEQ